MNVKMTGFGKDSVPFETSSETVVVLCGSEQNTMTRYDSVEERESYVEIVPRIVLLEEVAWIYDSRSDLLCWRRRHLGAFFVPTIILILTKV